MRRKYFLLLLLANAAFTVHLNSQPNEAILKDLKSRLERHIRVNDAIFDWCYASSILKIELSLNLDKVDTIYISKEVFEFKKPSNELFAGIDWKALFPPSHAGKVYGYFILEYRYVTENEKQPCKPITATEAKPKLFPNLWHQADLPDAFTPGYLLGYITVEGYQKMANTPKL